MVCFTSLRRFLNASPLTRSLILALMRGFVLVSELAYLSKWTFFTRSNMPEKGCDDTRTCALTHTHAHIFYRAFPGSLNGIRKNVGGG